MAEWRAEQQNYHIKPGFPMILKSIMKIKVLKPSLTATVSFEIMLVFFEPVYLRAAGPFHLPHYICPHTDVNYAWSSKANFPNV